MPENRIRQLRHDRGMTLEELADHVGISPSYLTRLELGKRNLSHKTMQQIAGGLGVSTTDLIVPTPGAAPPQIQTRRSGYSPPPDMFVAQDLPVFSAAEGGEGEMLVSTDPVDYTVRPLFLAHVKNAYAVYVTGTSMEPRCESGEKVYVNPTAPLAREKDVILVADDGNGEFRASIKRLVRWDQQSWTVRQYNPPREWQLSRAEWPHVYRVFGRID